jgi:hypothetical protein
MAAMPSVASSSWPSIPVIGDQIESDIAELTKIRAEMVRAAAAMSGPLATVHVNRRSSAENLVHYPTLRRHDIRSLQVGLAALGLSSLGRAESHALATIDAVLAMLHGLVGRTWIRPDGAVLDFETGRRLLEEQTELLLGPASPARSVRIMVTMPSEAAAERVAARGRRVARRPSGICEASAIRRAMTRSTPRAAMLRRCVP